MRRPLGILASLTLAVSVVGTLTLAPGSTAAERDADSATTQLTWKRVDVDTDQQLRGLDVVDARHAWVGGSEGGVWTTDDGGRTWADVSPKGAKKLLFRDVEATDALTAQVLAIGEGEASRIYRTTNGGLTWQTTFVNRNEKAFYDCMTMWPDGEHGLAMSDPVKGKFKLISTSDAGRTWQKVSPKGMPGAVEGEFAFAASGTCLVAQGRKDVYLASGGGASRIFVSRDRGLTWAVHRSTIPAAAAGGVFSVAFKSATVGIAVGGDFESEDDGVDMSARTVTGGRSWTNAGDLGGYRSGVDFRRGRTAIAVGPSGSDVTHDAGKTWTTFSSVDFDAVQCVDGACWASGPEGAVGRLVRR